jgi:hypothetical protein
VKSVARLQIFVVPRFDKVRAYAGLLNVRISAAGRRSELASEIDSPLVSKVTARASSQVVNTEVTRLSDQIRRAAIHAENDAATDCRTVKLTLGANRSAGERE